MNGPRWHVEAAIPLAAFGGDTITMIEWRPSCGNDELIVGLSPIPEPGTLVLAGGGLVLLALLRRRRST